MMEVFLESCFTGWGSYERYDFYIEVLVRNTKRYYSENTQKMLYFLASSFLHLFASRSMIIADDHWSTRLLLLIRMNVRSGNYWDGTCSLFLTPLSVDGCLPLAPHLQEIWFLVGVDRAVRRRSGDAEQDKASTYLRLIQEGLITLINRARGDFASTTAAGPTPTASG